MGNPTLTVEYNGKDIKINVIDIIKNLNSEKEYIVYYLENDETDFYISILDETETTYTLKTIEDESELKMVQDYLEGILIEEKEGVQND